MALDLEREPENIATIIQQTDDDAASTRPWLGMVVTSGRDCLVRGGGLEPPYPIWALAPQASASTNFAILARWFGTAEHGTWRGANSAHRVPKRQAFIDRPRYPATRKRAVAHLPEERGTANRVGL